MQVLVVGGTGNISTGVVKALVQFGHEVTVYNRGKRRSLLPAGVRTMKGDRLDRATFEAAMQAAMQAEHFDAAIDMTCFTPEDAESDVRAFRGVKQFIQTSTVATFGGPLVDVPTNEASPLRPVIPYGHKKVAADAVFEAAHARGELPVTIFKPGHTWGPGVPVLRQFGWHASRIAGWIASGAGCPS